MQNFLKLGFKLGLSGLFATLMASCFGGIPSQEVEPNQTFAQASVHANPDGTDVFGELKAGTDTVDYIILNQFPYQNTFFEIEVSPQSCVAVNLSTCFYPDGFCTTLEGFFGPLLNEMVCNSATVTRRYLKHVPINNPFQDFFSVKVELRYFSSPTGTISYGVRMQTDEPIEGYGANGGHLDAPGAQHEIFVTEHTETALRNAIVEANLKPVNDGVKIHFSGGKVAVPGTVLAGLVLNRDYVTVEGHNTTIYQSTPCTTAKSNCPTLFDIRGHHIVVKDLAVRNGDNDNIRIGSTATENDPPYRVVLSHVTSTGANDDGLAITHGTNHVTIQYSFFGGNSRSIFISEVNDANPNNTPYNISLHHNYVAKQWSRGPYVSKAVNVDIRNHVIEGWTNNGVTFQNGASGNVVKSAFWSPVEPAHTLQAFGTLIYRNSNIYESPTTGPGNGGTLFAFVPVMEHPFFQNTVPKTKSRAGILVEFPIPLDELYMNRGDTSWTSQIGEPNGYRPAAAF